MTQNAQPARTLSLRERRRRQTQLDIQTATLKLAIELGYAQVTADMIAARAGISVRTFFNYYPNKLAAAVGPIQCLDAEKLGRFVTSRGPLLEHCAIMLTEMLEEHCIEKPTARMIFELSESTPEIASAFIVSSRQTEADFTAAIAARAPDITPDLAVVITRMLMHAFGQAVSLWAFDDDMPRSEAGSLMRELVLGSCARLTATH